MQLFKKIRCKCIKYDYPSLNFFLSTNINMTSFFFSSAGGKSVLVAEIITNE